MANTGRGTVDGDMMRYAEYSPQTHVRSDAEIDRRLVRICFHTEPICRVCPTTQNVVLLARVCVR